MNKGVQTIIFPVRDVARAKSIFSAVLGAEPIADQPYYVGYKVADQDIGLDPNGHNQGMTGPVAYWHVDDLNARLEALKAAGAQVVQEPRNVGGGRMIASVKDPDGNPLGLLQDG